ncbi:MAG: hypothetical protein KH282_08060 [Clostridiales bacterium]|nr:hypothetical protein [Clostridiales bacterium]
MIICTKKRCVWRVDCGYGKAVCHKQFCPYMRKKAALPPKPPENDSKWDAAIEILRNYARRHGYDEQ